MYNSTSLFTDQSPSFQDLSQMVDSSNVQRDEYLFSCIPRIATAKSMKGFPFCSAGGYPPCFSRGRTDCQPPSAASLHPGTGLRALCIEGACCDCGQVSRPLPALPNTCSEEATQVLAAENVLYCACLVVSDSLPLFLSSVGKEEGLHQNLVELLPSCDISKPSQALQVRWWCLCCPSTHW